MDFRVAPAARATNSLLLLPPFRRRSGAFTWVESIICVSVDRPLPESSRNRFSDAAPCPANKSVIDGRRRAIFGRAIVPNCEITCCLHRESSVFETQYTRLKVGCGHCAPKCPNFADRDARRSHLVTTENLVLTVTYWFIPWRVRGADLKISSGTSAFAGCFAPVYRGCPRRTRRPIPTTT